MANHEGTRKVMRRSALLWVLLVALPAFAQDDVLMRAMRDELDHSMKDLQLEKLERPYFLGYRVQERSSTRAAASFGSLLSRGTNHSRSLTVEVRVGDYALDNTNFVSLSFGPSGVAHMFGGTIQLPLEDNYKELRRQIWLATDSVYKRALEDLSKKRAALQNKTRIEEIPDFSKEEPAATADEAPSVQISLSSAEALVRELSAVFRDMPAVFHSTVQLDVSNVSTRYLNSEGTSFRRSTPAVSFTVLVDTQATDGMPLADSLAVYGRSMDDLPPKTELAARIRELGARLTMLRGAPLVDRYNGPVLFERQAAAELFSQVFAPKLLAIRRPISDSPQFASFSDRAEDSFLDKIGARVLPTSLNVVDNPTLPEYEKSRLMGAYRVDDDGIRARETRLVEKGILKTLLATRDPVRGITQSTGSHRGAGPAPGNLFLVAENGLDDKQMKEELLKVIKQRGKDYGIIVRRLGNPALSLSRDQVSLVFAGASRAGAQTQNILLAYKVFPDGREELIRNAELSDFNATAFKDIVAASRNPAIYTGPFIARGNFASPFVLGFTTGDVGGVFVSFVVPSLLFEDLTIKKPTGEIPNLPVAKHPFFDR